MLKFTSLLLVLIYALSCSPQKTDQNSAIKIVDESLVREDLLKEGSFQFLEADYTNPAYFDSDISNSAETGWTKTDIRGRIFVPTAIGPRPLIVFLHGNHATCGLSSGAGNPRLDLTVDFTETGACPSGYIEAPSYRGYDQAARLLASKGYIVVSINANRGITGREGVSDLDYGLVFARGNLVLRHLEELSKANNGLASSIDSAGFDLKGKIDLGHVGMMGHSRGGEGVRQAYNSFTNTAMASEWQSRIPGLQIKGIFEIGPVDMGTESGRNKVDARGVAWNVLIPGCDHDVYDFAGVGPYERMLKNLDDGFPKSVFTLWGANHNFFNTEWQVSDAPHSCEGSQEPLWNVDAEPLPWAFSSYDKLARSGLKGSETQVKFAQALMMAFFDAHLSGHEEWSHVFDPQYRLPAQLSSLASTSREYFVGTNSRAVLNADKVGSAGVVQDGLSVKTLAMHLSAELKLMEKALADYTASGASPNTYQAALAEGQTIPPALVITGSELSSETLRKINVPLQGAADLKGIWTLDMSLAVRKDCYGFDRAMTIDCERPDVEAEFEVALELADGRVTAPVSIRDYVKLDNFHSRFFAQLRMESTGSGKKRIDYAYLPLLYQSARFELSDFGLKESDSIKSVVISFRSKKAIALAVESIRLTKRN